MILVKNNRADNKNRTKVDMVKDDFDWILNRGIIKVVLWYHDFNVKTILLKSCHIYGARLHLYEKMFIIFCYFFKKNKKFDYIFFLKEMES